MKKFLFFGPVLIAVAAVLWGVDGILRRSLYDLPASVIVFYEHLIGAVLIFPFFITAFLKEKKAKLRFSSKDWLVMAGVALFSGVLGTIFFTTALLKINYISFSVVFLLQKLQPIFAVAAAATLLKERITRRYVGWALLALGAAYFVTFPGGGVNLTTGEGTIVAALFALGAAFCWGASTAFSRYLLVRHSNTLITGWRFILTVPLALVAVLILGKSVALGDLGGGHFWRLVLIALTTGMVALWIYYRGLKLTQAKISTIVELLFPLTAVVIDIFLYDTVLAPSQYLAAVVLLFAIYRISRLNRHYEEGS